MTLRWPDGTEAAAQGAAFAAALGCTEAASALGCLRGKTRDQVAALPLFAPQVSEIAGRTAWLPNVDGLEIPAQPRTLFEAGLFAQVPSIVGVTRDEAYGSFVTRSFPGGLTAAQFDAAVAAEFQGLATAVLALYPATLEATPLESLARLVTDGQFVCEAKRLARLIDDTRTPAYLYSYDYVIDDLAPGRAIHGVESNILFGNDYVPNLFPNHPLEAEDLALHSAMAGYWSRFIATGNPSVDDDAVVHWQRFRAPEGRGADRYLVLDRVIRSDERLREVPCGFWDGLSLRSLLGTLPAAHPD